MPSKKIYRSFTEARAFVHSLKLKSTKEWNEYRKSGSRPEDIPSNPNDPYKNCGWSGWGDWLGTNRIASRDKEYLPFEEARAFVHKLGLKTAYEWTEYCKSGKKPDNIPTGVYKTYENCGWISMGDWLGTNRIADQNKEFLPFEEARVFVHSLKLKSTKEWKKYCKSGKKPDNIPSTPNQTYIDKGWISMGDWLGTGYIHTKNRTYISFEKLKKLIAPFNLKSQIEWYQYWKENLKPNNIPANPSAIYKEWTSWADFLGYLGDGNSWTKPAKLSIINLLEDTDLLQMDPFELMTIIGQGSLPQEFTTLLDTDAGTQDRLIRIQELKARLEGENDDEDTPTTPIDEPTVIDITEQDIIQVDAVDNPVTTEEPERTLPTLNNINALHSLDETIYASMDSEAFESLVQYKLRKLWNQVLNGDVDIKQLKKEKGGTYFTQIKNEFFNEYNEVIKIKPKAGYQFKHQPNLMQQLTVSRLLKNKSYGNWSGTGAGKTLSFILASRELDARLTVVIALNSIIENTCKNILAVYPNSKVFTEYHKGQVFDRKHDNYLVLNYEKFQQGYSEKLYQDLTKNNQIDFVVIDEVHNVKQRTVEEESQRRAVLTRLLERARKNNPDMHVLAMSATPVVNNLTEAKSLLSLMTGLEYDDLETRRTLGNAFKMFQQLLINGLRYLPKYDIEINELTGNNMSNLNIDGAHLLDKLMNIQTANVVGFEKLLIDDKLTAIKPYLRKGVIVYTQYTTGFINKIRNYIESCGYKVATYTGDEGTHTRGENLRNFINGDIDILLGSKPIGTGVDGLQGVCNRMILLTLPWTDSEYTQLKGRIYRQGSVFNKVEIVIPQVKILTGDDEYWSWDMQRLNIIKNKRTLSDAAVDGLVPSSSIPSPETLLRKSVDALREVKKRIKKGQIVEWNRSKINIELYPEINDEETRHKRILAELSEFNRRGKTTKSSTMHKEFTDNPDSWFRYHKLRRESMNTWDEVPYEYIATKIKNRNHIVVDFGCGENLMRTKIPQNKVISFDHVSIDDSVIACDMKDISQYVKDESVDVAVFSLALWGTNYRDYIKEAYRVLNYGGVIHIAEPAKDYETAEDEKKLVKLITNVGFKVIGDVEKRGKFIYITGFKE